MAITIVLLPVLLLSLAMIFKLLSLRKHDRVLYRFCQLRRDIMAYLRDKRDRIPPEDYEQVRMLLQIVNQDIHNYNHYKRNKFNIRYLLREARHLFKSARAAEIKKIKNNAKVEGFYKDYGLALVSAFLSYTPFFKSKIILMLTIGLMRKLVIVTGDRLKDWIKELEWLKQEIDKPNYQSRLKLG